MRQIFFFSLLLVFFLPSISTGQEKDPRAVQLEDAELLHKQAIEAFKENKYDKAMKLWTLALDYDENWKYSFNLASVLEHQKKWKLAWHATDRALGYGVPDDRIEKVRALQKTIDTHLEKDHAFIELVVDLTTATVTLNGEPWPASHKASVDKDESVFKAWVDRDKSVFVVDGGAEWKPQKHEWAHAIGGHWHRSIELKKAETLYGAIAVEGAPDRSEVYIDGRRVGILPGMTPLRSSVGTHAVKVVLEDHETFEVSVDVKEGETFSVRAIMAPYEKGAEITTTNEGLSATATTPEPSSSWVEWTIVGSGIAVLGIGASLLVVSQGVADDANSLNEDALDFITYTQEYNDLQSEYQTLATTGWILAGVGVATAITGGILLLIGSQDIQKEAELSVQPFFGPGTGGISATFSF